MKIAIETEKLSKKYKDFFAVKELDLRIPQGAVYGFLGPNGAGKTTTLKMLTGMTNPSSGIISIFGELVTFGSSKNRNSIGFLPDVPGFYNWMNASEYLDFCGSLFSIDQTELKKTIFSLLEMVGLKEAAKKKIRGFSRGMKQRLGIAQALINDPRIIFLDEPVSALDPMGRKEVMDIIAKLSGRVTVFFSTHVLEDVERICDRVIIIKEGRVIIEDTIENIKSMNPLREIEIEIEGDERNVFFDILNRLVWIEKIKKNNDNKIRLTANDVERVMIEIPGLLHENKIKLKKFNVLEPTLEDIFIKAVTDN